MYLLFCWVLLDPDCSLALCSKHDHPCSRKHQNRSLLLRTLNISPRMMQLHYSRLEKPALSGGPLLRSVAEHSMHYSVWLWVILSNAPLCTCLDTDLGACLAA